MTDDLESWRRAVPPREDRGEHRKGLRTIGEE